MVILHSYVTTTHEFSNEICGGPYIDIHIYIYIYMYIYIYTHIMDDPSEAIPWWPSSSLNLCELPLRSFLKFPRDPSGCIAIVPFFTFVVRKARLARCLFFLMLRELYFCYFKVLLLHKKSTWCHYFRVFPFFQWAFVGLFTTDSRSTRFFSTVCFWGRGTRESTLLIPLHSLEHQQW